MLDRLLVNNSHVRGSGDYLRESRRDSIGERPDDSVVLRTGSMKFRKRTGETKEEGPERTIQRTRSFETAVANAA